VESNRTNFVIIGRIRTGSSQLCSALDAHSKICCKLELLKHGRFTQGVDKVESYLRENIYHDGPEPVRGFKIMYHQFWGRETPEFYWICNVLKEFDVKVMHIQRRNFLDHFLSIILARQCDIWNAWTDRRIDKHFVMLEDDTLEKYNQPVHLEIKHFKLKLRSQQRWVQSFTDMFPNRLDLYYEDLDLGKTQQWLGVEEEDIKPSTIRMRTKTKRELISNYDEVAAYLKSIGQEWMLAD
jgi:LPS sulfotransferase NodH